MMAIAALGTLYQDHGGQSNTHGDISILQGACVGGSTIVNAALCFRTPDIPRPGGAGFEQPTCPGGDGAYFDKVRRNLRSQRTPATKPAPARNSSTKGLKELGIGRVARSAA